MLISVVAGCYEPSEMVASAHGRDAATKAENQDIS